MSKSDDITKQESEIIKSSIIHIESGDHLITDEAKRHKLALMVACAFVCMISLYPNAHVGSLFGIVKFSDGSEISILKILPYALLVMTYQGIMYAYHLSEAKKAQVNKKLKSIREDNIHLLNEFIELTNNFSDKINNSTHRDFSLKNQGHRFSDIRETISSIEQKVTAIPDFHTNLTNLFLWSGRVLHNVKNQDEIPLNSIQELHNDAEYLIQRVDFFKRMAKLTHQLKSLTFEIDKKCDELDGHFISQYNYYLIKLFDINTEHNKFIKELTQDKISIIDALSKTAFSEKKAFYIYTVIPTVFFFFSLGFALFTYVKSF
ncbi:hypothetical protein BS007_RS15360 [Vibrio parahaemolyticus]|nr:hypothetical protein [Vibrio parahaemolyticus]